MARRGSIRSIFFALLAGAGAGAAQLGLGYGFNIISWVPAPTSSATSGIAAGGGAATTVAAVVDGAWSSGLAWATWVTATSVVVGAVVGDRLMHNATTGPVTRAAWRLVLALAATLGALVVVPLVAVPASRAHIGATYAPHLLVGVYAAAGAVIGLVVALVAMTARAAAVNVFATAVWLWTLAIIAVTAGAASGRAYGYAQLGVWKFTDTGPIWRGYYLPGTLLLLGGALLVGGLGAFTAAGRGDSRLGVVISGAAGPLLVTAAYLLARPAHGSAPAEQVSVYYTSPFMILAGLAGSALLTAVGGGFGRPRRSSVHKTDTTAGTRGDRTDAHHAEDWSRAGLPG